MFRSRMNEPRLPFSKWKGVVRFIRFLLYMIMLEPEAGIEFEEGEAIFKFNGRSGR